jgi:hypothetical protein
MVMKTPKFLYLLSSILFFMYLANSCQDSFSEEDFLRLQAQLAAKKDSAALQEIKSSSLLLAWSVQVQDNRKPVEGALVELQTAGKDSSKALTLTTDAQGIVVFSNIAVGGNLLRISKQGYLTANVAVEFAPNTVIPSGSGFVPVRRTESSIIPLFSNSSTETATIKGTAKVETDLTNGAREAVPQGTRIRANIAEALQNAKLIYPEPGDSSLNHSQSVLSYAVEGGENVGVAVVDGSGNFTMTVPALSEGVEVRFIYDNFESTVKQAIWMDETTGLPVTPAYASLSRFFGPDYTGNSAPVQWIPGAMAVFPAPPPAVSGFAISNFTVQPRSLGTWNWNANYNYQFSSDDIDYWVRSVGSNLQLSPTITISGGGGSGASMNAWLAGVINNITVTNDGGSYIPGSAFKIQINWVDGAATKHYINSFNVFIEADSTLPNTIAIPTSGSADNGTYGLTSDNPFFSDDVVTSIIVTVYDDNFVDVTNNVGVTATASSSIFALDMTIGGSGYTSAPTITFSGGGAGAILPVIEVLSFATTYSYSLNNSGNTGNYVLAPNVDFYLYSSTGIGINNTISFSGGVVDDMGNINNLLAVKNGDIVYVDPSLTYLTQRSSKIPYATVKNRDNAQAMAMVNVSDKGKVDGLNIYNTGSGYVNEFGVVIQPTVAGAPGAGALVALSSFSILGSGEYDWNGNYNVVSGGTNYLQGLNYPFTANYDYSLNVNGYPVNLINGKSGNFPSSVTVFPGNTYEMDVFYGTGAVPDAGHLYPGQGGGGL